MKPHKTEGEHIKETREKVLKAALPNVAFDGWSETTLAKAVEDSKVDQGLAKLAFPRGVLDLVLAFHYDGDEKLAAKLAQSNMSKLKYSQKVAFAIRTRMEMMADSREAVRRAVSFLSLPIYASEGSAAIWNTSDTIWNALGDTSRDVNWYTKRLTLSAVYSSAILYWLGDETPDSSATADYIDRRIENVLQFEKFKSSMRTSLLGKTFMNAPFKLFENIKAPGSPPSDLPGYTQE